MPKILIVEDDPEINRILDEFLSAKGYGTVCLYDGLNVTNTLLQSHADLVLLDIMLPYRSGDRILDDIRSKSDVPVIIISAKGTTQNKIDLLRLGADDYITKPFDLEEALARIESNLRRRQLQSAAHATLHFQNLKLNTDNNTSFLKNQELLLTAKEYAILELLMKYPDKIFSKANLFQSIWKTEYFSEDNTLNVHISNLRSKLKAVCPDEEYIDTVWGIGYRLHQEQN